MPPTNDNLIGRQQKTGLLRCIGAGQTPVGLKQPRSYLNCVCACGRIVRVSRGNFLGERVRSCGCCTKKNYAAPRTSAPDVMKFSQTSVNH